MYFYENELCAIVKMAKSMAAADGRLDPKELILIAAELAKFTPSSIKGSSIIDSTDRMEFDEAIRILRNLTTDEKKYVGGYLAAIMAVDGHIDAKEAVEWQLVSTLAQFPTMSAKEALDFWKSH